MNETAFPGHQLRQRREEQGLTLDHVYLKLRVAPQFIEALEAGNIDALPGKTYAIGFIKSYCAFLDEDPHPYLAALGSVTRPPARRPAPLFKHAENRRPSWLGEAVTWGTVVGVLLAGWIAYSVVVRPDATGQQGAAAAGTIATTVQQDGAFRPGE